VGGCSISCCSRGLFWQGKLQVTNWPMHAALMLLHCSQLHTFKPTPAVQPTRPIFCMSHRCLHCPWPHGR
jgi:hypothetical protein